MLFFIELINTSDEVPSGETPLLSKRHPVPKAESIDAIRKVERTPADRPFGDFQPVQCKRSSCCVSQFGGNIFQVQKFHCIWHHK